MGRAPGAGMVTPGREIPAPAAAAGDGPSSRRALLLMVIAGGTLRLTWLLLARPEPVSDFADYASVARGILDHHQFGFPAPTAYRLPLYPLLLSGCLWICTSVSWLSLCNVALSTAMAPLAYAFVRLLLPGQAAPALVAAGICSGNPTFVCMAPVLASEHLFGLLLVAGLLWAAKSATGGWRWAILAGMAGGSAVLTRGEGVFYLPVLAVLSAAGPRGRGWRRWWRPVVVLGVSVMVVTPWIVRNRATFGSHVGLSTSAGLNLYLAHHADGYGWRDPEDTALAGLDEAGAHQAGRRLAWAFVQAHPAALAGSVARGTFELFRPSAYAASWSLAQPRPFASAPYGQRDLFGLPVLRGALAVSYGMLAGLALYTVASAGWRGPKWGRCLCAVIALNWLCYAVVFWSQPRYRYVSELMICLLAAPTLYSMVSWLAVSGTAVWDSWWGGTVKRRVHPHVFPAQNGRPRTA